MDGGIPSLALAKNTSIAAAGTDTALNSMAKSEEVTEVAQSKDQKKSDFVPVNKTFRKVQALLLAKEKAMKNWDMKDSTFSDKIRNIHVTEGI